MPKIASTSRFGSSTLSDTPTLVQAYAQMNAKFKSLGVKPLGGSEFRSRPPTSPRSPRSFDPAIPARSGILVIGTANPAAITALRNSGYKGLLFGEEAATNGSLKPAGARPTVSYTPSTTTRA